MMEDLLQKAQELTIKYEGFRSHIYKDSRGYDTIGYGTNLDVGISEAVARAMLSAKQQEDNYKLLHYLSFFKDLNEPRQMVLIDMCYNLGIEGLLKFHGMLFALEAHDYVKAHDEMLISLWAKEVGKRAIDLALIMLSGEVK